MPVLPKFKLYNSSGTVLIYEFKLVQSTNLPQSPMRPIEIEGVRGKGVLVVDAGTPSWDAEITGLFAIDGASEGYEEITALIVDIEDKIPVNTPFKLRLDKTDSTYWEFNVKRIEPIDYPTNMRTDSQEYTIILKVNSW